MRTRSSSRFSRAISTDGSPADRGALLAYWGAVAAPPILGTRRRAGAADRSVGQVSVTGTDGERLDGPPAKERILSSLSNRLV